MFDKYFRFANEAIQKLGKKSLPSSPNFIHLTEVLPY